MSSYRIHTLLMVAPLLLAAGSAPALAYCPSVPDGPASYNVQNGTARAVCQQAELAVESERIRQNSQMRELAQSIDLQQLELQQRLLTLPPVPAF